MKTAYRPPKKKGTLAQRIAAEKKLIQTLEEKQIENTKARLRMAWAFVISMGELEGVNLSPEQIAMVVDNVDTNMTEYETIKATDGEDVADTKMYMRVCEILGQDPSECDYRPERIFDFKTILREAEANNERF